MKIFKRFFGKFFWFGLIVILISSIIDLKCQDNFFINIIVNVFSTIGVALVIGAIFDFSKNSQDFMDFVSNILKEIIVSKNFLKGLEQNEKKKALEMVLIPSGNQLEQCSDIEMYFQKKINETMEIFHTNFKTNLVIQAEAKKVDNIVQIFAITTYRVYKVEDKYFPLVTTFERNGCSVEKTYIIYDGIQKEIIESESHEQNDKENVEISPTNVKKFSYEIPEELYKYPYLTIRKEIIEKGYDHWTNFHWNTLTPADGVFFSLKCNDNLKIKEYFIFGDEKSFCVTEQDDKKSIDIVSTVWLDKNSGVVFTISDIYRTNA